MKRTTLFRILTLLYIAVVAVICFARFSSLPIFPGKFLGLDADKVVHYLMFLPFPLLAFFSFRYEKRGVVSTILLILCIFVVGALIAGITEYVQGQLPYRTMDINDYKADLLGLFTSCIAVFFVRLFTRPARNA